jgi:uncharacterized OB-fold protein
VYSVICAEAGELEEGMEVELILERIRQDEGNEVVAYEFKPAGRGQACERS